MDLIEKYNLLTEKEKEMVKEYVAKLRAERKGVVA